MLPNHSSHDYLEHLTGITQRQVNEALGTSAAQKEIDRAIGLVAEFKKLNSGHSWEKYAHDFAADLKGYSRHNIGDLARSSSAAIAQQDLLGSLGLGKSFATEVAAQLSLKDYAVAIDISSQVKKLGYGLLRDHNLAAMAGMVSASRAATDALPSLTQQVAREYERAAISANWSQQLSKSMTENDLYRRFAETLDIRSSLPADLWSSAADAAKHSYEHLFTANDVWREQLERLAKPDYLTSLLSAIEQDVELQAGAADSYLDEPSESSNDEESLRELSNAESPEHFAEIFSRCSRWVKWAVFTFVVMVVWPIMLAVAANLVTPSVEQYLHGKPAEQQCVQVREIKKLPMTELGVELKDYRFSTAKNLVLRSTPSARASQVGILSFGQVVAVVSVKRDWTEVAYEYGDGEAITGWVFTRYLEKFRR